MKFLRRHLRQWLGMVLEFPCPLCQRSTPEAVCLDCQRQIQRCQFAHPQWQHLGSVSVFGWGHYGGALKQAIAALKYNSHPHLAQPLGHWMAQTWIKAGQPLAGLTVIPIPMYHQKQQERGFNQAELLALQFCAATGLPLQIHGLERIRATEAQFRLSALERAENLNEAFHLGKPFLKTLPTRPVLLLDDIYTTGATVHSAAHTLRRHGIRVGGVVVLAQTTADQAQTLP